MAALANKAARLIRAFHGYLRLSLWAAPPDRTGRQIDFIFRGLEKPQRLGKRPSRNAHFSGSWALIVGAFRQVNAATAGEFPRLARHAWRELGGSNRDRLRRTSDCRNPGYNVQRSLILPISDGVVPCFLLFGHCDVMTPACQLVRKWIGALFYSVVR